MGIALRHRELSFSPVVHQERPSGMQKLIDYENSLVEKHSKPDTTPYTLEDKKYIQQRESQFATTARAHTVLEILMQEMVEAMNWLSVTDKTEQGTRVIETFVHPASRYDDIANGVDAVMEWKTSDGTIHYMGFDITAAGSNKVIDKKLDKIVEHIQGGELGTIKYFTTSEFDKDIQQPKQLHNIPIVIIGIDQDRLDIIRQSIAKKTEALGAKTPTKALNAVFGNQEYRLGMLEAIKNQLYYQFIALLDAWLNQYEFPDDIAHLTEKQQNLIDEIAKVYYTDDLSIPPMTHQDVETLINAFHRLGVSLDDFKAIVASTTPLQQSPTQIVHKGNIRSFTRTKETVQTTPTYYESLWNVLKAIELTESATKDAVLKLNSKLVTPHSALAKIPMPPPLKNISYKKVA